MGVSDPKIFATCSLDKTAKIWTIINDPTSN